MEDKCTFSGEEYVYCKCPLNDRCGTTLSGTMSTPVNQSKVLMYIGTPTQIIFKNLIHCLLYNVYNLVFFSVVLAQ